ncbi:hypothetical protein Catovirus_1_473 [Catovirus CTV1]|uniref:Uncharacterized protein n=1 Tax=Catovirus CTV1 TaxID=1977631 RepID=A0A1V0S9Q0_9VIRU|nr:hypothetical protein Catovirus_1_473 [Catovirus CTV1]
MGNLIGGKKKIKKNLSLAVKDINFFVNPKNSRETITFEILNTDSIQFDKWLHTNQHKLNLIIKKYVCENGYPSHYTIKKSDKFIFQTFVLDQ